MQGKIKGFLAAALFFSMMLFAFWSIGKTVDQYGVPIGRSDRHDIAVTRMYCDAGHLFNISFHDTTSTITTTGMKAMPGTIRATRHGLILHENDGVTR